MLVSVIVPVYNEEVSVKEVLNKIREVRFRGHEKEVIVVNDGSIDRTLDILMIRTVEEGFKLISYDNNRGKGHAIRKGLEGCNGDFIVIQDGDMEYDPSYLPSLINPLIEGDDVVYGSRFLGEVKGMSLSFYLGNRFLSMMTSLLYGCRLTDMETGSKAFRRPVLEGLSLESNGFEIEPEITAKVIRSGFEIIEVPIDYHARSKTEKKITPLDGLKALYTLMRYRFWRPRD